MLTTVRTYLPEDAPQASEDSLQDKREELRLEILRRVSEMADDDHVMS